MKAFELTTDRDVEFRFAPTAPMYRHSLGDVTLSVRIGDVVLQTYLTYDEAAKIAAGFMTVTSPAAFEEAPS